MKNILTSSEMKKVDTETIERIGIPGIVLMERAALSVASLIMENEPVTKTVQVIAGVGNNGADGLAICRMLHLKGYNTCTCVIGDINKATKDFKTQLRINENLGISIVEDFADCDIFVDAILGVGLSREVEGKYKDAVEYINNQRAKVYAVDIPSGIDGSTGEVLGVAIKADYTVTFGFHKVGTVLYPGADYCGKVIVSDIGYESWENSDFIKYATREDLKYLPRRINYSYKGNYGKVLIIAGSKEISGAAALSALAAFKTGAGMVRIFTHENNRNILGKLLPEAMINTYTIDKFDIKSLQAAIKWCDVIAVGPGMGTGEAQTEIVNEVLESKIPTVIDADGINTISRHNEIKEKLHDKVILTPHLGEMSRFLAVPAKEIAQDLIKYTRKVNYKYGATVVLKDARTVMANKKGTYINLTGNSGMATAGSGDVLTGIMVALLGTKTDFEKVPALATFLHGVAGDLAAMESSKESMMAGDICNNITKAYNGDF
jgi:YjeF C-terminal domain protein